MRFIQNHKRALSSVLVIFFSILFIVEGVDKFFNLLDNWPALVNPRLLLSLITPALFMKCVGVVEIILGVSLLTRWRRVGSYLIAAWLVMISINLFSLHLNLMAAKDILMAMGAIILAKLSE
jgi:hypothetical protein